MRAKSSWTTAEPIARRRRKQPESIPGQRDLRYSSVWITSISKAMDTSITLTVVMIGVKHTVAKTENVEHLSYISRREIADYTIAFQRETLLPATTWASGDRSESPGSRLDH